MVLKPYEEFKAAIRMSESSGHYNLTNRFGYLGAYQFGAARLCDLGLTKRIPGTLGFNNSCFQFIDPKTAAAFLSDSSLQDLTFDRHVADYAARFRKIGKDQNLSGAIAGAHLVGFNAALDYLEIGKISRDANGKSVEDYFKAFEGFEIP